MFSQELSPTKMERRTRANFGDEVHLTVRNRRFSRESTPSRWWLNGDPFGSIFFTVHSASFPRGEAAFIDAVREFSDDLPPKLSGEVRSFMRQESNHSREHAIFNRLVENSGYDLRKIDEIMAEGIAKIKAEPTLVWLGTTMALEHYTAIAAHELLTNPIHMEGMAPRFASIWRWHAIEEIEHKAVAFDVWLHVTRDWSAWKRWRFRSQVMIVATIRFVLMIWNSSKEMLDQDGLSGWKNKLRFLNYMFGKPGLYRRMIIPWLLYFKPGFHPWDVNDRHLIAEYEAAEANSK
ncbi:MULTISPECIES: metal-dependent hydrolase [unclassified Novosphingobium]|uniref:metal-dependent hydrolase n=1 Tax=unclassified Novosphingobium TaxID=2644732 RepID=UPI0025EBF38F|nr:MULTISPECIES: metal-dependent hydrolase [unclassified Novosphingobium]HQV04711.1 metal-dependent hydrolase [Novosphingobium sp.]